MPARPLKPVFDDLTSNFSDGWGTYYENQPQRRFRDFHARQVEFGPSEITGDRRVLILEFHGAYEVVNQRRIPFFLSGYYRELNRDVDLCAIMTSLSGNGNDYSAALDRCTAQTTLVRYQCERYVGGQWAASFSSGPDDHSVKTLISPGVVDVSFFIEDVEGFSYVSKQTESFEDDARSCGPVDVYTRERNPVAERPFSQAVYRLENGSDHAPGVGFLLRNHFSTEDPAIIAQSGQFDYVSKRMGLVSGKETFYETGLLKWPLDQLKVAKCLDSITYNGQPVHFELRHRDCENIVAVPHRQGRVETSCFEDRREVFYENGQLVGIETIVYRNNTRSYRQQTKINGVRYAFCIAPHGIWGLIGTRMTDEVLDFLKKIQGQLLFQRFMKEVDAPTLITLSHQALSLDRDRTDLLPEAFFGQQISTLSQLGSDIDCRILPRALVRDLLQLASQDFAARLVRNHLNDAIQWLSTFFQLYAQDQAIPASLFTDERFGRAFPQIKEDIDKKLGARSSKKKPLLPEELTLLVDALAPQVSGVLSRLIVIYSIYQETRPSDESLQISIWVDAMKLAQMEQSIAQNIAPLEHEERATILIEESTTWTVFSKEVECARVTAKALYEQQRTTFERLRRTHREGAKTLLDEHEAAGDLMLREQQFLAEQRQVLLMCGQDEERARENIMRGNTFAWRDMNKAAATAMPQLLVRQQQYHAELIASNRVLFFSTEQAHRQTIVDEAAKRQSIAKLAPCLPKAIESSTWDEEDRPLVLGLYRIELLSYLIKKGIYFNEASFTVLRRKAIIGRSLTRSQIDVAALQSNFADAIKRTAGPGWLFYLNDGVFDPALMKASLQAYMSAEDYRRVCDIDITLINPFFCCEVFSVSRAYGIPMHPLGSEHHLFETVTYQQEIKQRLREKGLTDELLNVVSTAALTYVSRLKVPGVSIEKIVPQPPACVGL